MRWIPGFLPSPHCSPLVDFPSHTLGNVCGGLGSKDREADVSGSEEHRHQVCEGLNIGGIRECMYIEDHFIVPAREVRGPFGGEHDHLERNHLQTLTSSTLTDRPIDRPTSMGPCSRQHKAMSGDICDCHKPGGSAAGT